MLLALYVFEGITSPLRTYWYFLSLLLLVTWSTWHRTRCQTLTAVYRILISKSLPGFIFKLLCTVTFACLNCTWRSTLELNHLKDNCSSFCFQNTAFLLLLYSLLQFPLRFIYWTHSLLMAPVFLMNSESILLILHAFLWQFTFPIGFTSVNYWWLPFFTSFSHSVPELQREETWFKQLYESVSHDSLSYNMQKY